MQFRVRIGTGGLVAREGETVEQTARDLIIDALGGVGIEVMGVLLIDELAPVGLPPLGLSVSVDTRLDELLRAQVDTQDVGEEPLNERLSNALMAAGTTDECENADLMAAWEIHGSVLTLYCDGGDAFDPGTLFFWAAPDGRELVHIPPTRDLQDQFIKGTVLDWTGYLAVAIAEPTAWRPLAEAENGPRLMEPRTDMDDG